MTQLVLIGKDRVNPGIVARLEQLGNETDEPDNQEKSAIADIWSLLETDAIPISTNEMVFKVARRSVRPGRIWTWIGCYRYAAIAEGKRANTYIGCGIAALNMDLAAAPILGVITHLVNALYDAGAESRMSVSVFDHIIGTPPLDTIVGALRPSLAGAGLNCASVSSSFVDLSPWSKPEEFNPKLIDLITAAQDRAAFTPFAELIIGNTANLEARARRSRRHTILGEKEWTAPDPKNPDPFEESPQSLFPPTQPPYQGGAPFGTGVPAIGRDVTRREFHELTMRIAQIEYAISGERKTPMRSAIRSPEGRMVVIVLLVVLAALTIWGVRTWWRGSEDNLPTSTSPYVPAAEATSDQPATQFEDCPQHQQADDSGENIADPAEVNCLVGNLRAASNRLNQIKRGTAVVTLKQPGTGNTAADASAN